MAEASLLRTLTAVLIIGTWEASVRMGWANPFFVSQPSALAAKLADFFFVSGKIYPHLAITLLEVTVGLACGSVLGILSGLALATRPRLNTALEPFIMGLYGMPRAALAPLFIIWFGIGIQSKIFFAGFVVFFILLINVFTGVKAVDRDLVDSIRTMGAKPSFIYRRVVLPSCIPWILSGIRVGVAFALTGAVFAEMLAAESGIGLLIVNAAGVFDTTTVLASVLVLALVAVGLNALMKRLEMHLLRWRDDIAT